MKDFDTISAWLDKIGQNGALDRYFRPEGHPKVKAVPIDKGKLRLYCFRVSDNIVVFAGGAVKNVAAFQDDWSLERHALIVKKVGIKLLQSIERGKVTAYRKQLFGELTFDIDYEEKPTA